MFPFFFFLFSPFSLIHSIFCLTFNLLHNSVLNILFISLCAALLGYNNFCLTVMNRLRKSLRESFRRKKDHIPESSKPHQWQDDEQAVRSGSCSFPVKYLGCVEVFESRGMQICDDALKLLRVSVHTH